MFKAILIASFFVTGTPVCAAQDAVAPGLRNADQEVHRVDPGKTLKLIKRIKDAGGRGVAS